MKNKFNFKINNKHIVLMLFLFSFIIRILFMNDGLFLHDSVQLAEATEDTIKELELKGAVHGRYGLVLINALFYSVPYYLFDASSAEFTVTFVTILLSSLAVSMIYLFVRELIANKFIAIASAALFSVNPLFLSITTYAKSHGPAVFFAILAGYLLLRALKSGSNKLWFLFSVCFAYALLVRIDNILFIVPFGMLYLFPKQIVKDFNERKAKFLPKRFGIKKIIILAVPFILLFLLSLKYKEIFSIAQSETIPFNDPEKLWVILQSSSASLIDALTSPLAAFIFIALVYFLFKKNYATYFLLLWFLAIFLPLGLSNVASPRLYVVALIPLMIIAGIALNSLYKKNKIVSLILLFLFLMHSFLTIYPVIDFRHQYSGPKEFGLSIKNSTEDNAVIIANDASVFINYYANKSTISYPRLGSKEDAGNFVVKVHNLLNEGIPVYVPQHIFYFDTHKTPKWTLTYNFDLVPVVNIVTEEFHHSELQLQIRNRILYKINKKYNRTINNIVVAAFIPYENPTDDVLYDVKAVPFKINES